MNKKILSIFVVAFMLLSVFSTVAFADTTDVTFDFTVPNVTAALGNAENGTKTLVAVPVIVTSSAASDAVGCDLIFDPTVLNYVSWENVKNYKEQDCSDPYIDEEAPTIIELNFGAAWDTGYDNEAFVVLTFEFLGEIPEGETSVSTTITPVFHKNVCIDSEQNKIPAANETFTAGTITIAKQHQTPVIGSVTINGTGEVGSALTATPADFEDNWDLEPTYSYEWKIGSSVVSTEATYTPVAADIDKTVTVSVKATVDADENAESDAKTATKAIKANETATASVANFAIAPEEASVGEPITVSYAFTPSINGGEDASEIVWYNAAEPEEGEPAALSGEVSADGKTYTPSVEDYENGVVVGVAVTPKGDKDVAAGRAVTAEAAGAVAVQKPVVTEVTLGTVTAGKPATVSYKYDGVGDSDACKEGNTIIEFYMVNEDEEAEEDILLTGEEEGVTIEGDTITLSKDFKGAEIYAVVTPVNAAGVAGEPVASNGKVVKSKKGGSGGLNGPSLAPSKQDENNNNNNNNNTVDTDKFILTIDSKEASVWGVVKTTDVAPIIVKDRTMLPIRFVAENLGFEVEWDNDARKVTITKGEDVLTLVIDSDIATVNGEEVKLDSAAYIDVEASRTMVPLRFIAENLGYNVEWVNATRQVVITK
ncbi:MAG: copper amine oxidase N-terminal domain-containing protein [Clostridia bacterium]|nr:copper amine oxidase N-terminal domain-containing protein [Clostridia bacterium]